MSTNTFSSKPPSETRGAALNAGIVGLGFIGEVHARAIRATGHHIQAVAAASLGLAEEAAAKINVDNALTVEDMVTDPSIDVIHICTPNIFHAPIAELAITNGKHVICEKPLATTAADAERLTALATEYGVVASIPFIYRYYPSVREAKARIAGEKSDINLIHGYYLQDWLSSPQIENWRIDPALGGPSRAFGDIGVHWCDLVEFITGERIVRVNAQLIKVFNKRGKYASVNTEDGGTIIFQTANGAQGSLVLSQISAGRKNKLWFSVESSESSFVFDQENPDFLWQGGISSNQILTRGSEGESPEAQAYSILPAGHPQGYQDCFNAFVAETYSAIRGGKKNGLPQFADGLRAARLTEAVLRSAEVREWVEIG